MNARFWVWWNDGWVKLTLRPEQKLECGWRKPTDEGWSSYYESWEHDGSGVLCQSEDDGVDCDGRLTRNWEGYCPLERLSWVETDDLEVNRPAWERGNAYQRDYSAEACGY